MPPLKPGTIWPTPEEEAMIQAGIDADPETPELDDEWFARARPAREVLPEIFGAEVAAQMLRPRGRPPLATPKRATTIRLDADVMDAFRAAGRGWQTRINAVLREAVAAGKV